MALAVVTNYVTSAVPRWAEDSWMVWGAFSALVIIALALHLWGRRLDGGAGGMAGRPVAVGRIVAGAATSLIPPVLHRPVRGREWVVAELEWALNGSHASRRLLLRRSGPGERFAVMAGAGGMGKTTVAATLAERAAARGTPVFWIRWRTEAELAERMVQVAISLGLSEETLEAARAGRISLSDTVWDQLSRTKTWLIVLDNLDEVDSLNSASGPLCDYRGWIRPSRSGLLLITSRITDPAVWGSGSALIRITALSERDAAQVLLDSAPTAGTFSEAAELAYRVGCLPLALHSAARYLSAPGSRYRTFSAYQQALDTELGALLGAAHPHASDPEVARTVVRHTWELSLDQLTANGNSLARPVLGLLSMLAPGPIPLSYITPGLITNATGLNATPMSVEAAVNGLHAYGLLNSPIGANGEPAPGLVVLHPLVREVIAFTLSEDTAYSTACHHALARRIIEAIDEVGQGGLNSLVAARHLALHSVAVAALAGNSEDSDLLRDLLILGSTLGELRADIAAFTVNRQVVEGLSRLLGPSHRDTLGGRNNLALTVHHLGRHQEAADLHAQIAEEYLRTLGPDHPETLNSRNNLALALSSLGRYQEAVDLHTETAEEYLRVLGPDDPRTLNSRDRLALVLRKLGRYQEAADLHAEIADEYLRIFGPDDHHTLNSRSNLAVALQDLGRYQEAADLHAEIADEHLRALGPDHPDTLGSRNNLALTLSSLGRHQEAADLHQQTFEDRLRALGPDHPDTLDSRNNLINAQTNLGRRARWYTRIGIGT
ncbi:tetratricopeptide repeat protein [Streptomyces hydrogenans]|uniref:tetratricopeptide repeat protein n=1 Tax=Streptomyces hydrogenans TaxID=1873719 RepID=UPI0036B4C8BD